MSGYNAKNFTVQGGEKTVIGGKLIFKEGAGVTGLPLGAAFYDIDLNGVQTGDLFNEPLDITPYFSESDFDEASAGRKPVFIRNLGDGNVRYSLLLNSSIEGQMIGGIAGYPLNMSGQLATILSIIIYKSFGKVLLRVNVNEKLAAILYEEIYVDTVELSEYSITLQEGEAVELTGYAYPVDAENKTLEWYSDDSGIASVSTESTWTDESVTVTGTGTGTTVITARSLGNPNAYASCTVEVTPIPGPDPEPEPEPDPEPDPEPEPEV